jgi:thiosulfate dehydrogenase (quinone) large subunit
MDWKTVTHSRRMKLRQIRTIQPRAVTRIPAWPISKFLFFDHRVAGLWLVIRCYIGYQWLVAGWGKLTGYSLDIGSFGTSLRGGAWVFTAKGDVGLKAFLHGTLSGASGPHPMVQQWYAAFLQHVVLPQVGTFAYVITFGELLVGLGLILGAFTGIAAFFGIFMNMNYLLAGSVSINPILCVLSLFLVLAWRISGFYGVDRYLLPLLGTPWTGSLAFNEHKRPQAIPRETATFR